MTNPGKFKFVAASKRTRSMTASPFKDIGSIIASEGPLEDRRLFLQSLRNTLRCKDLVKQKQALKDILNRCQLAPDHSMCKSLPFAEWSDFAVASLVRCAQSANNLEMKAICKLLAVFFKDYGDQESVKFPFRALLSVLEKNLDGNAEPVFGLISTHFSANSRILKEDVGSILSEFDQWLRHNHQLVRRLSMESFSVLLRRQTDSRIFSVICGLLCLESSEHLLFGVVKNVHGTVTTRLQPLFKFLISSVSQCDFQPPEGMDMLTACGRIATGFRKCLLMLSHHYKAGRLELNWLDPIYDEIIGKLKDGNLAVADTTSYSTAAELAVEMFCRFAPKKQFHIKDMGLMKRALSFEAFLSHFLLPLLCFAKDVVPVRNGLFEEICQLLVRFVRTESEATKVLSKKFDSVLEHLICFMQEATEINHVMTLLEWRLKSENPEHISHCLLVMSVLIEYRDAFHPFLINPNINRRVLECIKCSIDNISGLKTTELLPDKISKTIQKEMSILFGCLKGVCSISSMRCRMKTPPLTIEKSLLETIMKGCLTALRHVEDPKLTLEVTIHCLKLMDDSERSTWMTFLLEVVKEKPSLLLSPRLLDECVSSFNDSLSWLAEQLVSMLPSISCDFRKGCIRFFIEHFGKKGMNTCSLKMLLDMESLEISLENERKKVILIVKCIETLDINTGTDDDRTVLMSMISRILLSQYHVKFSPLWEATSEAYNAFILKIASGYTGKMVPFRNSVMKYIWRDAFSLMSAPEAAPKNIGNELPGYVQQFIARSTHESTDYVTRQRELLAMMTRVIAHMPNKDQCLQMLTAYVHDLMVVSGKDTLIKCGLSSLATLLQKYKTREGIDQLVEVCLLNGIRSNDATIRECCLSIIAQKYQGIDIKRLQMMATEPEQKITSEEGDAWYRGIQEPDVRELSIGIELRMLCPKLLQHNKQAQCKNILDYLSTLEPRYLSLLIIELLPTRHGALFLGDMSDGDEAFRSMVKILGIEDNRSMKPPLQRAIRAIRVLVRRMKKILHLQASPILQFCCLALTECTREMKECSEPDLTDKTLEDCNTSSVVAVTIPLMVDLVTIFDNLFDSFLDILSGHSSLLKQLLEKNKDILPFILCLTERKEHLDSVCDNVLSHCFGRLFKCPATPELLSIMENIFCLKTRVVTDDEPDSDLVPLLVSESGAALDCIKECKPVPSGIIKGILSLPIDDALREKCLSIILSSLPKLKSMSSHKASSDGPNYESLKHLRNLLDCIQLSMPLLALDDLEKVNRIWDFVNECLFYIGDVTCRRMACMILSSLPMRDEGIDFITHHLLSMNDPSSGSMDAKADLETNCQHLAILAEELKDYVISAKLLYSTLCHALFMMLYGHKDPGIRRCVLNFTFAIMEITKSSLAHVDLTEPFSGSSIISTCEHMDSSNAPFLALLLNGVFPFIRRSMSGLHIRGSLFTVCIEILEKFSKIFSSDSRLKLFFGTTLHGDLLCNDEIVECLANLRGVQKYNRQQGLKQLLELLAHENVFTPQTAYRILGPICMQFMLQSASPNYALFRETSRDCLVECASKLSAATLFKFLRLLVDAYYNHKNATALESFSLVIRRIRAPTGKEKSSILFADDESYERSQFLVQKFRRLLMRSQPNCNDLARPEVFEALGGLLRHYSEETRELEVVKQSRLLGKSLCSRSRAARKYARLSIIKFLQCMGFEYFPLVIKELSAALTRGFQLQVLIFTTHSILSTLLRSEPGLTLSPENGLHCILGMITSEMVARQERGEQKSKIDEGRHPKAITLIELLGEFGDLDVCLSICSYLWSILKGTHNLPETAALVHSVKLLNTVEQLLLSCIRGLTANKSVDLYRLGSSLFYGYLAYIRGMVTRLEKQLPKEVYKKYKMWTQVARESLKRDSSNSSALPVSRDQVPDENKTGVTKREEFYTLYPGTATGRALPSKKKSAFDDHIISPMFVNAALRLYNQVLTNSKAAPNLEASYHESDATDAEPSLSSLDVPWDDTALGILLCFVSEDVKLQRSSASCLIHLCEGDKSFLELCGPILSEHLIDRIGSLHMVGSEDSAKDHLRLLRSFLRSESSNLLFDAWQRRGKQNELIDGLLLQIESNIDRPRLQIPLLKLFGVLAQLQASKDQPSNFLYEAFSEIFVRLLKGNLTPSALKVSSQAIAQFLTLVPMDESNRSMRLGMLLKHITSENSVVRLAVLQCIRHFLKGLAKKGTWKRYSDMIGVAIAMHVATENDLHCKREMASIISLIWTESASDQKKSFLECIAHFLNTASAGQKDAVYAYVVFHCISQESTISWLRKSGILETAKTFLEPLESGGSMDANLLKVQWQAPYYWLRILHHLLTLLQPPYNLSVLEDAKAGDPTTRVLNVTWRYSVFQGVRCSHPWIVAASLRALSYVLCNDAAYKQLSDQRGGDSYVLAKYPLRLLSVASSMVESHDKVGSAVKEFLLVLMNQMLRCNTKGDDKISRLTSKLCYSLRNTLGKPRHCFRRIDILLSLLQSFVNDSRVYQTSLRATMLRVMIALTRTGKCKPFYRIPPSDHYQPEEGKRSGISISEMGQKVMSIIEAGFGARNEAGEYLKLLGFARDFVSHRKQLRRTKALLVSRPKAKKAEKKRSRSNKRT